MGIKGNKQSKIIQILLAPTRIFSKAVDFYTRSMINCAGKFGYSSGPVRHQISDLSKSFTINSSASSEHEEYRRLLQLQMNLDLHRSGGKVTSSTMGYGGVVPKSYSVGVGKIGRIDEERPCSFRILDVENVYLRSRSHAVKRNVVYYK